MSFGRPPSINLGFKPNAPDRGSFPLDHYGNQYIEQAWRSSNFHCRGMQGEDSALHDMFEGKRQHIDPLSVIKQRLS
jgi:hypothetical protein